MPDRYAPAFSRVARDHEKLNFDQPISFGQAIRAGNHVHLDGDDIAYEHAVMEPRNTRGEREHWLYDRGTSAGTFINRHAVVERRLEAGDFIQIGSYAWLYDRENARLTPLEPISGAEVCVDNVQDNKAILHGVGLKIPAGQFVALVGSSGAGKSTLAKIMAGIGGLRRHGTITVDGIGCDEKPADFRRRIGYVAQETEAFRDLTAAQTVELGVRLRGCRVKRGELKPLRRRFDVQQKSWGNLFGTLSGGEKKRVLVAVEFARKPKLLILDEPTSGLDVQNETKLMRLLRGLSYQGCTVVLVTHGLGRLDFVDRVVGMHKGRIAYDGPPDSFNWELLQNATALPSVAATRVQESPGQSVGEATTPGDGMGRQVGLLMQREFVRLKNSLVKRLSVAVALLPLIFALSIALAVPFPYTPGERALLAFLSILACVWLGTSLSLTSIVDEIDILDHERLLFLHWSCYVCAKWLVLLLLAVVQVLWFAVCLAGSRWLIAPHETMLFGFWPKGFFYLLLTTFAAVGLGLFISSLAVWLKRREAASVAASVLVALAMMWQILFSVQIAGAGDEPLHDAYRQFRFSREAASNDEPVPHSAAVVLSYCTISRFADIALRSFAYDEGWYEASVKPNDGYGKKKSYWTNRYQQQRRNATLTLAVMVIGFPVLAWLALVVRDLMGDARQTLSSLKKTFDRLDGGAVGA